MMNPKWITETELVGNFYEGYWARNGPWKAAIRDRFRNLELECINIIPDQRVPVAGIVFAGDCGISKVEVSMDGGTTW